MHRLILTAAAVMFFSGRCFACLWDHDTLAMEQQRFPEAREMIAGFFPRHSDEYYCWRIEDRTKRLDDNPTPADFDDIAVAHDKLDQHDKAIETIREKIERWPEEGRYESEANLGTFLIHDGQYEEGLRHIERAIELNPQAHFGREIYQKLLVEYVITKRAGGSRELPLEKNVSRAKSIGFAAFVLAERKPPREKVLDELRAAAKGVMGMMRFGQSDSPILHEALGDLMLSGGQENDSKMLAARAYLRASYEAGGASTAKAYRKKAENALEMQLGHDLEAVEADLKAEMKQADDLFRQIGADERGWIDSGKNVDAEFASKYYNNSALKLEAPFRQITTALKVMWASGAAFVVSAIAWLSLRRYRSRRIAAA